MLVHMAFAVFFLIASHQKALMLVLKEAASEIAEIEGRSLEEFDIKKRQWTVRRPFLPGLIDSRHVFVVEFHIDSRSVAVWTVQTDLGSIRSQQIRKEP